MSDLVKEAGQIVHGWTGKLDAPTEELRVIEKLAKELEQLEKTDKFRVVARNISLEDQIEAKDKEINSSEFHKLNTELLDKYQKLQARNEYLEKEIKRVRND